MFIAPNLSSNSERLHPGVQISPFGVVIRPDWYLVKPFLVTIVPFAYLVRGDSSIFVYTSVVML